jgi:hypothetical protein
MRSAGVRRSSFWTALAGLPLILPVALLLSGCNAGPIGVATLSEDTLTNGLAAHWTFDDGFGSAVSDSSGNGRVGTITYGGNGGNWNWIPMPYGQFKGALYLSGSDSISVPSFPQPTAGFTVSAWVRVTGLDLAVTPPPLAAVLSNETLAGGWAIYLQLPTPPSTAPPSYSFAYYLGPGQNYAHIDCDCFAADTWTHLTAVVDPDAGHAVFYAGTDPRGDEAVSAGIWPGQTTLLMGRWPAPVPGPPRYLTGALDDVAIWTRALAAEEVAWVDEGPGRHDF